MSIVESEITNTSIRIKFSNGQEINYKRGDLLTLVLQKGGIKQALSSLKTTLKDRLGTITNIDDITLDFSLDGTPIKFEWTNR